MFPVFLTSEYIHYVSISLHLILNEYIKQLWLIHPFYWIHSLQNDCIVWISSGNDKKIFKNFVLFFSLLIFCKKSYGPSINNVPSKGEGGGPPSKPIYCISLFSNLSRQGEGEGSKIRKNGLTSFMDGPLALWKALQTTL